MLNNILNNSVSSISITSILICSVASLILGSLIAITHKYTSKYNKNFLVTITVLPLLVQSVIIMVNGDLGTSIATIGAFGLIRFRSIPGTSKEILIVFFATAVGLATGMGHVVFGAIMTAIGCLSLFTFNHIKIYDNKTNEKILKVTIPENLDYTKIFDEEFKKYTKEVELEQVKTVNMGSLFELTYKVTLNKGINEKQFIDDLRIKNANLKIILSHPIESSIDL